MAYSILIVDDSATTRKIIAKTLALSGLPLNDPLHTADGVEALEALKEHWIDLVLLDLHMPRMSGVEVVRKMSEDEELRSVSVVLVTAEGSQPVLEEMQQRGVRAYIRKPFTPEAIKDVVEAELGGQIHA